MHVLSKRKTPKPEITKYYHEINVRKVQDDHSCEGNPGAFCAHMCVDLARPLQMGRDKVRRHGGEHGPPVRSFLNSKREDVKV